MSFACGEIFQCDFRKSKSIPKRNLETLKVFSFNIERGYCLKEIIQYLKSHDADLILLQEVDMNCERTGNLNIIKELAKGLEMQAVWACEFEELKSSWRAKHLAGGGEHGNAILSKYPLAKVGCEIHKHIPLNWERLGTILFQPRRGSRVFLWANVQIEENLFIRCYSVHLENFCGIADRLIQMSEVFAHFKSDDKMPLIIGGDFNTLSHGIARWTAGFAMDGITCYSLGYSESSFWRACFCDSVADNSALQLVRKVLPLSVLNLLETLRDLNEPFHPDNDITRRSILCDVWNFYEAKLDWLMADKKNFEIKSFDVGPEGLSDHQCVFFELQLI